MNRNSQKHFANIPDIDIKRSQFNRPQTHKTTFTSGDIIPIYVDEILPGDTVNMRMAGAIRMATPIFPVMDNAYIDTYYFYVPFRLVWEHFQEFMGENKLTAWEQPIEYQIPQIKAPENGWEAFTIADYMGVPTKISNFEISALYFRAYALIWNEWFRDQNLKDAAMVNTDETTVIGSNDGDYVENAQLGAKPLKAARYHSYFTSALPEPQKGPDVLLPLGNVQGMIPVVTGENHQYSIYQGLRMSTYQENAPTITNGKGMALTSSGIVGLTNETKTMETYGNLAPVNLWAKTSIQGQASTINQLRQAFAVQRLYERDARGGKNCASSIKNFF